YVRLHHVEHKQAIALDQARVDQLALEVCIALRDEWRTDLRRIDSGEPELLELVNVRPVAVPDSDHGVYQVERRDVDHAFLAPADERKAVVLVPDIAADESRLKSQHHVPAESHDVPLTPVRGADEHDGPRLEEATDLRERKVLFLVGSHIATSLGSGHRPRVTADTARRSGAHQAAARPETDGTAGSPGEIPATSGPSAAGRSSLVGGPRAPGDASRAHVRCCLGVPGSPRAIASPRQSAARASSLRGPRPRYLLAARLPANRSRDHRSTRRVLQDGGDDKIPRRWGQFVAGPFQHEQLSTADLLLQRECMAERKHGILCTMDD